MLKPVNAKACGVRQWSWRGARAAARAGEEPVGSATEPKPRAVKGGSLPCRIEIEFFRVIQGQAGKI